MARRPNHTVARRGARTVRTSCLALVLGIVMAAGPVVVSGSGGSTSQSPGSSIDPAAAVDPFIGTGVGPGWTGAIGTFPGADLPSGMMQWSPDTPTTSPELGVSGGYYYPLHTIDGFSLDHLSGAGCSALEDFPVVPFAGAVGVSPPTDPALYQSSFSHSDESASAGSYSVTLTSGVKVALTVTDRSGIGRFIFPQGVTPSILIDPEASEGGFSSGSVSVEGDDAFSGSDVAGDFCSIPGNYQAHFAAVFQSPFRTEGTWDGPTLSSGDGQANGSAPGTYATFAPSAHGRTTITMKVGLSYTSVANAAANLRAEQRGWNFDAVRQAATKTWNSALSRIAVTGGTEEQRRVFYTALYHSLLFPSLLSDENGDYPGLDGRMHVARGLPQYTNVSGWDIYRSQVPLLTMLEPKTADGLVVSLVRDAAQDGGSLPRWEYMDLSENEMGGDSADPIIADAYAFGARGYDVKAALAALVDGADTTTPAPASVGGYIERPGLASYLADGFVPNEDLSVTFPTSSASPDTASLTLEYATDDFTISELAHALGDRSTATRFRQRSQGWRMLFDPLTGLVAPKSSDRTVISGWPESGFTLTNTLAAHGITGVGEWGFQEGDAAQYTWMVPQDLAGLIADLGGNAAATRKLAQFFSHLNAGPTAPYDWTGNEPDLGAPFVADYTGAPSLTEQTTTKILQTYFTDAPDGEPGNDDLGALSSWAVWSMLGLYPETPGSTVLVTTSPTFTSATIHLADGKVLAVHARKEQRGASFVSAMTVDGKAWTRPWLGVQMVKTGGTIDETLVTHSSNGWGTARADVPPSSDP
jgi:predicted alpha-1,2-mannosidase